MSIFHNSQKVEKTKMSINWTKYGIFLQWNVFSRKKKVPINATT